MSTFESSSPLPPSPLPPALADPGPLSWVMPEIREALARSRTALIEAGGRAPEDQSTRLLHAKTHLHQAHGALLMIDIAGVSQITALAESALDGFKSGAVKCSADHVQAVSQLYQALIAYLEELLAGAPSQPVRLFPYYRALKEMLGAERIHPADLFFPDLVALPELPPVADAKATEVTETTAATAATPDYSACRQRFERALLPYMKSTDAAQQQEHAAALRDAVAAVAAAAGPGHDGKAYSFWLAMQAFSELVASGALAGSLQVKQLFGMINLQIRRLSQGNPTLPDALLRDALFFIAATPANGSATAQRLRTTFALDGLVPDDYATPRYGQPDGAVQEAGGASALEARGPRQPLTAQQQWQDDSAQAQVIGIKAGLRQIEQVLDAFHADPARRPALATLAPVFEALAQSLEELEQDHAQQAVRQVQAAVLALAADAGQGDPAHEARVLDGLAQNVGALGFFADLLSHNPAGARGRFVFDAQQGSFRSVPFGKIAGAEAIPVLDDAVPAPPPAAMPPAASTAPPAASADELLEVFLTEAGEVLDFVQQTLAVKEKQADQENQAASEDRLITLRRSFHTLKGSARMVALEGFAASAQAIERLLNTWLAEQRPASAALLALIGQTARLLRAWVAGLAAHGLPAQDSVLEQEEREPEKEPQEEKEQQEEREPEHDSPATLAPPPALLAIYLEEAGQLLDKLEHDFGAWRQQPRQPVNPATLAAVHTLAGSSGTVGAAPLRALALALETTLEALLPPAPPLDQAQHDLFDFTVARLRQMVDHVAEGAMPPAQPELIAALGQLRTQLQAPAPAAGNALDAQLDQLVAGAMAQTGEPTLDGANAATEESSLDAMFRQVYEMISGSVPLSAAPVAASRAPAKKAAARIDDDIDDLFNAAFDDTFAAPPLDIAAPPPEQAPAAADVDVDVDVDSAEVLPAIPAIADTQVIAMAPPAPAQPLLGAAPPLFDDDLDADLLPVFLEEGADLLPQVGQALRAWQHAPADSAQPQTLLRLLHTIKGSARMAGAMRLGQHVHEIETHIETLVNGGPDAASPQAFDELLAHYDHALLLFEQLQQASVRQKQDGPHAADAITPAADNEQAASTRSPLLRVRADLVDRLVNQAGEVSISRSRLENEVAAMRSALGDVADNLARLRRQLREIEMQAESQIASSMSRMSSDNERDFDPLEFDRFTRLQELTRMMAESVNDSASLHENLGRSVAHAGDDLILQARLTRELQRDLMRVRMVPFSSIAERLFRVARQSAKEVDKRVNLDIRGGSVEIDRSVLERMVAPFEHLLRNAIAHGVEGRERRTEAGKSDTGELLVEVTQQGNEVVIDFSDDGAGLDLPRIRAKALACGLLQAEDDVSDVLVADLIFQPGFSTAETLTELSGRGVGMDIVQSEAQALGGRVDMESTPGQGVRFTIRLPLTLAVTQVVLVEAGGRTYALPSILVEQVLQIKDGALDEARVSGQVGLHGHHAALHYLPVLLGEAEPPSHAQAQRSAPVLMLKNGNERLALQVDAVLGNREVVIKNIGPQLSRMAGIAGATVLGSGDIVLILNPVTLAQHLAQHPEARAQYAHAARGDALALQAPAVDMRTVMVVDDSMTVRRVTQRLLEREGYQVLLAKDGVDAIEQLEQLQQQAQGKLPELLLADIEMPRMDGFDLTRQLRGDVRTAAIPIIMITSRTADKHRNYAQELGVDAFFGKPFPEAELLATMRSLLAAADSRQQG